MTEPSAALARIFRPRLPKDTKTLANVVMEEASAETYEFLREVALEVPFSGFMETLSVQQFERLKILAVSDEFESVEEDAIAALVRPYLVADLRALPEYAQIRDRLRAAARQLATPEGAQQWLERVGGPRSRRALSRVLRATTKDPRESARAAAEVLDREIPAISRNADGPRLVRFDEKAAELLDQALERDRQLRAGDDVGR
jgi:hypothetical protein